jgi:tetratricopeptide (TPR) repeat protein
MRVLATAAFGLLLAARLEPAEEAWHEAWSENFVLMTNASPERAESLLLTLERFRSALGHVHPELRRWTSGRTRLYGFRDRASLEPFLPGSEPSESRVTGYFRAGSTENVIVLNLEGGIPSFERVLFHEYVHLVLSLSERRLPLWLEEGLSEYYAATRLGDREAEVGITDPRHRALLARVPLLSFDELVSAQDAGQTAALFYAQSWALVHYLLAEDPRGREKLRRFLSRYEEGADPRSAFRDAFGSDPAAMEEPVKTHVERLSSGGSRVALTASAASNARSRQLSAAEVQEGFGFLFLATARRNEARIRLEEAVRLDLDLGAAWEALGLLEWEEGQLEPAVRYLERAIDLGAASASGLYRYADILLAEYRGKADSIPAPLAAKAASALRASLRQVPSARAPAELLVFLYIVRGERLNEARALLDTALAIAPSDPSLLFLEGQLLAKRSDYGKARENLLRVMETSSDPRLREEAAKFLERMAEIERAPARPQSR